MELLEYHFSNLSGNLYYDNDTYSMFTNQGKAMHLNYLTFKELFTQMNEKTNLNIVETGIASAGTHSTYLFNEYIRKYGGQLWSVDINQQLVDIHQGNMCPGTTLVCDDSVHYLNEWIKLHPTANVVYLDSWDLDWYDPHPAAQHGLNEYNAILPSLKKDSLLLIDDTPSTPYWIDSRDSLYDDMVVFYNQNNYLPGKGRYVIHETKNANTLLHHYQILYKFNG